MTRSGSKAWRVDSHNSTERMAGLHRGRVYALGCSSGPFLFEEQSIDSRAGYFPHPKLSELFEVSSYQISSQ